MNRVVVRGGPIALRLDVRPLVVASVHAAGAPADVVDAAFVHEVFGVHAEIVDDPVTGTPLCLPPSQPRRARCM